MRYDMIWDMLSYIIWYMIWCNMIWYDVWYDMIWHMMAYMIYGMIWYHMIWYMIWHQACTHNLNQKRLEKNNLEPKWRNETDSRYMNWFRICFRTCWLIVFFNVFQEAACILRKYICSYYLEGGYDILLQTCTQTWSIGKPIIFPNHFISSFLKMGFLCFFKNIVSGTVFAHFGDSGRG